jgi:hypothetical protein
MLEILEGVGVAAIGVALGYGGLSLLGEYRRAFFENPRAVMTLEVFFCAARLGGPGYLAMLCLIASPMFCSMGVFLVIMEIAHQLGRF